MNIFKEIQNYVSNLWVFMVIISAVFILSGGIYLYSTMSLVPINEVARQAGEQLALQGHATTPPCTTCHGNQGEGNFSAHFPRLAGLHQGYIIKQLEDFARDPLNTRPRIDPVARDYRRTPDLYEDLTVYSPGIRVDSTMNEIARQLTHIDRQNLSWYYSAMPFIVTPQSVDYQTLQRGADIALRGKPEYRVPRCTACHGPAGEGFGPHFPPLVGQPTSYLIKQINLWQSGARDNDHLSLMKNTANQLTDADKINVITYFSNQSYAINAD